MSYDPPEVSAHWQWHEERREAAEIEFRDGLITACSICDPRRRQEAQRAYERKLMAQAWREGYSQGKLDCAYENYPAEITANPYEPRNSID